MDNKHQIFKQQQKYLEIQKLSNNLKTLAKRYAKLFHFSPIPYFSLSNKGQILNLNHAAISLLHGRSKNFLNKLLNQFISRRSKIDFKYYIEQLFKPNSQKKCEIFFSINHSDIPYCLTCISDPHDDKIILSAYPIKKYEYISSTIAPLILNFLCEAILVFDKTHIICSVNKAFCDLFKCSKQSIIGQPLKTLNNNALHFPDIVLQHLINDSNSQIQISNPLNPLQSKDYLVKMNIIDDEQSKNSYHIVIFVDITKLKAFERRIQHKADYDTLTQLPNYQFFDKLLDEEIHFSTLNHQKFALISIDIDKFKLINDSYGHAMGDILLKKFAKRLEKTIRSTDVIARIGGDEFNIILKKINDYSLVEKISFSLLESMNKPFRIQKNTISITISLGIAFFPKSASNKKNLLLKADQAMYLRKRNGGNGFTIIS